MSDNINALISAATERLSGGRGGATSSAFDMAHTDISNLANLLDPNLQHEKSRPEGQSTGYSLSEGTNVYGHTDPASAKPARDETEKGFSSPGGIKLPSTAVDVQIGLPVPSMTKAGREMAHERSSKKVFKPKGDDIWALEEVTEVVPDGGLSVAFTSKARIAPIPTKGGPLSSHGGLHSSGGAEAQGREEPAYDVLLRQRVGTEDIYLGVDFERDGSSASAEHVIVKVRMPRTAVSRDISLDVKPFSLKVSTPSEYYAAIPLPVQCLEGKAAAQWDVASKVLTVTLDVDPSVGKVKVM